MSPWHDSDAFWENFYPAMFHKRRWDLAPAEVDSILQLTSI